MKCPTCGQELNAAIDTCPNCGRSLTDPTLPVGQPDESGHSTEPIVPLAAHEAQVSPWAPPRVAGDSGAQGPFQAAAPVAATSLGYGDPQQYLAAKGQPPVGFGPSAPAEPPGRRRTLAPILIVVLAVVLVGGGVAVAGASMGWYGSGKQPAQVLPGSAVAYTQLDLDPSLAQQASAWQFLRDLPEVKAAVAGGQPDPKAILWKLMSQGGGDLSGINYDTDVKPWLGNRIGGAVMARDGRPAVVTAIQVTNENEAASRLRKWSAKADTKYDVTMRDGFALMTEPDDTAFVLGEIANGTLAKNPTFAGDFASLREPGVMAGWADLAALAKLNPGPIATAEFAKGRTTFALRFTADAMELAGETRGFADGPAVGTGDLGNLPADTGAAFSFSGAGQAMAKAWPSLPQEVKASLGEYGLTLPDDLVALLGNTFTVSVSGTTIKQLASFPQTLEVGLRVNTDEAVRAQQVLRILAADLLPEGDLTTVDGSILVAATTTDYLDRMSGTGGRLSGEDKFLKALPDHAKANQACYVDLEAALADATSSAGDYRAFVSSLRSFGAEYVSGAGEDSWSMRVVRS